MSRDSCDLVDFLGLFRNESYERWMLALHLLGLSRTELSNLVVETKTSVGRNESVEDIEYELWVKMTQNTSTTGLSRLRPARSGIKKEVLEIIAEAELWPTLTWRDNLNNSTTSFTLSRARFITPPPSPSPPPPPPPPPAPAPAPAPARAPARARVPPRASAPAPAPAPTSTPVLTPLNKIYPTLPRLISQAVPALRFGAPLLFHPRSFINWTEECPTGYKVAVTAAEELGVKLPSLKTRSDDSIVVYILSGWHVLDLMAGLVGVVVTDAPETGAGTLIPYALPGIGANVHTGLYASTLMMRQVWPVRGQVTGRGSPMCLGATVSTIDYPEEFNIDFNPNGTLNFGRPQNWTGFVILPSSGPFYDERSKKIDSQLNKTKYAEFLRRRSTLTVVIWTECGMPTNCASLCQPWSLKFRRDKTPMLPLLLPGTTAAECSNAISLIGASQQAFEEGGYWQNTFRDAVVAKKRSRVSYEAMSLPKNQMIGLVVQTLVENHPAMELLQDEAQQFIEAVSEKPGANPISWLRELIRILQNGVQPENEIVYSAEAAMAVWLSILVVFYNEIIKTKFSR